MKMTTFQLVFTGVFVLCIMLGVAAFALLSTGGGSGVGTVAMWGTMEQSSIDQMLQVLRSTDKSFQGVTYVQKSAATYESTLTNAIAGGSSPDLFLVSQDEIGFFSDKVQMIPYSAVSQSEYASSFIDEAQLFSTPEGSLALPFSIDPLVMYWNRDLFASAGVSQPPKYWTDFFTIAPQMTSLDASRTIVVSAATLGLWSNISHAKAILSALVMQTGDGIVVRGADGVVQVVFGIPPPKAPDNPAGSALQFYTEFANPGKATYSWNRSLPQSKDAFAGGQAAVYFGFASEYSLLRAQNPNLHFSVALLPQIKADSPGLTFGQMLGLAIPRTARNPNGALAIAQKFSAASGVVVVAQTLSLPPVRRDVVVDTSNNAAAAVFVQSARVARAWLDPNTAATDDLFKTMIESVVSGQATPTEAVQDASRALAALLHPQQR